ncbi:MAG: CBS domain-containing protein, partial [Myxococcota bacterium]
AEDGTLVGILSYRDLQETLLDRVMRGDGVTDGAAEHVESAMRPQPYTITPDARLYDAATRLCGLRLGCLPVVERRAGRAFLVGILTETDLLQATCAKD